MTNFCVVEFLVVQPQYIKIQWQRVGCPIQLPGMVAISLQEAGNGNPF